MQGKEQYEEVNMWEPNLQDLKELFDQGALDQMKEEVAAFPELEGIFKRFCQLRIQVQVLSRELLPLNGNRATFSEILAEQQRRGLSNPQRSEIMRWVNELVSAREPVIPGQAPLTDYDLKGAAFNWVMDPFELGDDERRTQELAILQTATRYVAVKLFRTIQRQLGEEMGDEQYDEEEEGLDSGRN